MKANGRREPARVVYGRRRGAGIRRGGVTPPLHAGRSPKQEPRHGRRTAGDRRVQLVAASQEHPGAASAVRPARPQRRADRVRRSAPRRLGGGRPPARGRPRRRLRPDRRHARLPRRGLHHARPHPTHRRLRRPRRPAGPPRTPRLGARPHPRPRTDGSYAPRRVPARAGRPRPQAVPRHARPGQRHGPGQGRRPSPSRPARRAPTCCAGPWTS